jgi:hypothetical protein
MEKGVRIRGTIDQGMYECLDDELRSHPGLTMTQIMTSAFHAYLSKNSKKYREYVKSRKSDS